MEGGRERDGWREGERWVAARAVESCWQSKGKALGEAQLEAVGVGELAC